MTARNIHVMGIDPGGTTGWYVVTVPRYSIFAGHPPEVLEYDWGEFTGPEEVQATEIARLIREVQGIEYKAGPAVICEGWTIDPTYKSTDPDQLSPIRIGAMLSLLRHQGKLGDATLTFQDRSLAKQAYTDERLRSRGLWVEGSEHIRDACRHAFTGLRRARENTEFAKQLWPYRALWTVDFPEEANA